ncbi:MAG: ornithine carbamoyltransferase [Acidobacteriales bacterium]|nr:ornithine carbamoyltransferase [Terriglobales bacterium]
MSTRMLVAPVPQSSGHPAAEVAHRDLISIQDLLPEEVRALLDLTALIKARPADFRGALSGKQVVMFFEKPSLRTRLTFEAGLSSLGGQAIFVDQTRSRLDERESLSDIARNLERWVDCVILRTFEHSTITGIAEHASIPVINALSDLEHPCQALADFFTLEEKFDDIAKVTLAYVGDGNNMSHSLMLLAASLGAKIRVATPKGYEPLAEVVAAAKKIAAKTGAKITITNDPVAAVTGADAIYTDVWASMGQEEEAQQRAQIFEPFQVDEELMSHAADHALFMHCLPAHRGDEVTDAVIDSPQSVVFDQAENRLHIQKAILLMLLGGGLRRFRPRSTNA